MWGGRGIGLPELVAALGKALDDNAVEVRLAATIALGRIVGVERNYAPLPAIIKRLPVETDAEVLFRTLEIVSYSQPPPVAALTELLGLYQKPWDSSNEWEQGIERLLESVFVRLEMHAVPALRPFLTGNQKKLRLRTAKILVEMQDVPKDEAVPVLISFVKDPDKYYREQAIGLLRKCPSAAGPAAPHLLQVAEHDPSPRLRLQAAMTILQLSPGNRRALTVLLNGLHHTDPQVRESAAGMVWHLGPQASAAVPLLARCLKDESGGVRQNAVGALTEIGDFSPEVVRAVTSLANDPDQSVRLQVRLYLEAFKRME